MSDLVCPECGKRKRAEFATCYQCGTDACPRCEGPKRKEFEVCYSCAVDLERGVQEAKSAQRSRWSGCGFALAVIGLTVLIAVVALLALGA